MRFLDSIEPRSVCIATHVQKVRCLSGGPHHSSASLSCSMIHVFPPGFHHSCHMTIPPIYQWLFSAIMGDPFISQPGQREPRCWPGRGTWLHPACRSKHSRFCISFRSVYFCFPFFRVRRVQLTCHLAKRRSIRSRRSDSRRGVSFRERRTVRAAMAR